MAFGILAHALGKLPLKQLTEKLGKYELDFVQLALSKAISDIDLGLGKLSPGLANHIAEQFERNSLRIGVLGCYINPIHPDPVQRRYDIERFKEHIRFARQFGTSIVATETGDLNTYLTHDSLRYREIGWDILKATIEELTEEAEKWGVFIGLEPVYRHTLSSSEKMKQLLEEIPSNHLGVVFDPCNLLDLTNIGQQDKIIADAFDNFGERIVLAHLKDVNISEDSESLQEVQAGSGQFNITGFLSKLHQHKPFVDISIEGVNETNLKDALRYLNSLSYK
ncbi:sugar phosphate isomerase/epimerase [Paenibacillus psychroresistens]|uniref:Sugar phosphate isomerase/epimerase n=2 Tax=Paenibacillus psychroresistens TaxID=1778678 RepID=A0A6B8RT58_9BACL|nr:sugar phosphate isomerase/epimerase [Paenibacillus psychroresistens]